MLDLIFSEPIPLAFQNELEQRMYYISDEIEDFRVITDQRGVAGVSVRLAPTNGSNATEVKSRILTVCNSYKGRRKPGKAERRWSNTCEPGYLENAFEQMTQCGLAFQTGRGLVAVSGTFMALIDYIDGQINALVKKIFSAVEYQYPTLITSAVMRRSGYFRSFPQLMMFVTRLHSDCEAYTDASQTEEANYTQHYRDAQLCLPPTMCYHTYSQFADATFHSESGRVVTAKGKAFRFESRYEKNLERLWDFTIREVVFLGTPGFVEAQRQRLMAETFSLLEAWQLTGYCETANDSFFAGDLNDNGFVQRLMALKYELRLNTDAHTTVAAASFNLHNDFFSSAFNIRHPNGQYVRTACAGFGLERLAFAFLCQHGLVPAGWPADARNAVAELESRRC